MPKRYPPEFRRKVPDLVTSGRRVAQIATDLDISDQTIYNWRRQQLIDSGQVSGITSTDQAELIALAGGSLSSRRKSRSTAGPRNCSSRWSPQKTLPSDRCDGLPPATRPARLPGPGRRRVGL
jgi:transposase-like protein